MNIARCSHDDVKRLLWLNIENDTDILGCSHDDYKKIIIVKLAMRYHADIVGCPRDKELL